MNMLQGRRDDRKFTWRVPEDRRVSWKAVVAHIKAMK